MFPLKQFIQTNAALLEAMEGETASNNELMHFYLRTIPALPIATKLLQQYNVGAKVPN